MKYYYDVTSNGICFGKFTKENWANAYAAKLVSKKQRKQQLKNRKKWQKKT